MGEPITINIQTGRLIELRITKLTVLEVPLLIRCVAEARTRMQSHGIVSIIDLRLVKVLSSEVFERVVALMLRSKQRVERVALLVAPDDKLAWYQAERAIRESANPNRAIFRQAADAEAWLADVLTEAERVRLGQFLRET